MSQSGRMNVKNLRQKIIQNTKWILQILLVLFVYLKKYKNVHSSKKQKYQM